MERLRSHVGARPPWKDQVVDGVRLAYDDEGSGPALLCLHANGHGARDFEALRERLRGRFRVIALDAPGHGNSGDDHAPFDAERLAELVEGFVSALGLREVVVLGNSIGGAAALRFAARAPEKLRALVLVDTAGLDRVTLATRIAVAAMTRLFRAGARGAPWFPTLFSGLCRVLLPLEPAHAQRKRIAATAREIAPVAAQAWPSFARPDADLRHVAESLSCPVFVAWAEGDRVSQLSRNRPAIARIPGARLELFPGGHAPFLECPDLFVPALERFLDSL